MRSISTTMDVMIRVRNNKSEIKEILVHFKVELKKSRWRGAEAYSEKYAHIVISECEIST